MSFLDIGRFNSLSDNSFTKREDVVKAFHTLFEPLVSGFSPGRARVQLDLGGASFDRAAIDFEGFSRPLWGIVPYVVGGGKFDHWDLYIKGLTNGSDPDHPEYWGETGASDQRQVELAALGYALAFVPEHIWDPLDDRAKQNVITWIKHGRDQDHPECNWKFFRIMVDLGLEKVGSEYDEKSHLGYLDDIERYYIDDGWYRDGDPEGETLRIDYYNPFAMHYYGLVHSVVRPNHPLSANYKARAKSFTLQFLHWFSSDGSSVPYGRSLTYRFACGAFWGALAFANEEALPWGVIKGLYLRHWRWWSQQPIMRLDQKLLTIGYGYPNQLMCESYNSACSPYWAMKMFIPLALPSTHPFWTAQEVPFFFESSMLQVPTSLKVPGMVAIHHEDHTELLVSGPERLGMPFVEEKYGKFAYSSRYGFSVEGNTRHFYSAALDNMIGFSLDGKNFQVRSACTTALIAGSVLYCSWKPYDDCTVETWTFPVGKGHVRIHRINSRRNVQTIEGGYSIPRADFKADKKVVSDTGASVYGKHDASSIINLDSTFSRKPRVHEPLGNTNVMFPRTLVPQLLGEIKGNTTTVYKTAVIASQSFDCVQEFSGKLDSLPSVDELEQTIKNKGELVGIYG